MDASPEGKGKILDVFVSEKLLRILYVVTNISLPILYFTVFDLIVSTPIGVTRHGDEIHHEGGVVFLFFLVTVFAIVVSLAFARVFFEYLMAKFRINNNLEKVLKAKLRTEDNLEEIKNLLKDISEKIQP